MEKIRDLEYQFKDTIEEHLIDALPHIDIEKLFISSNYEDTKLSFDLVFDVKLKISVRIRKAKYIDFNDITIRSKSKKNNKTEIHKLMEGKGQYYYYAFMNRTETDICKAYIIDIDTIRLLTEKGLYKTTSNKDNTAFNSYKLSDLRDFNGIRYSYDYSFF